MSTELLIKGLFAAVIGLVCAWVVFSRYDSEVGSENAQGEGQRYLPLVPGALLPLCLFCLVLLGLAVYGAAPTARMALSMCFGIFLHISLYYVALLLLLPLLRKRISARACAMLWLLPNYLYITVQNYMQVPKPLLVIKTSGNWVWLLFKIWLLGFAAVLLWNIGSHLRFRRRILKQASPVTEAATLALWRQEIEAASIKKPRFQLVVSPKASSPLTVGLFRRAQKVVLPARPYSQEELRLIFRHEIVHIGREDSWAKFFLVFCTAMCWFNPLMWVAMRKSADDMELSCDETVLLGADGATRRRYANLLLTAAGDDRGFTTCLSAAAASMRYRLKSVVKPRKRRSGAILVGLTFFALCMTCGYVALAYGDNTGAEVLFQHQNPGQFQVRHMQLEEGDFTLDCVCQDEAAFNAYLAGLEMDYLTGNYSFSQQERQLTCIYETPQGTLAVVLSDHVIKLAPLYGQHPTASWYYLPQGVDWNDLRAIVTACPVMHVQLKEADDAYGRQISATLDQLTVIENGEEAVLYASDRAEEECSGLFGACPSEAVLSFSHPLAGAFGVEIETWDRSESYVLSLQESSGTFSIPLPAYPAHYRVYGQLQGENGALYRASFRFDVGEIDDP